MSVHRRKFWPALIVTGALTLGTACAGGDSAADDGSVTVEFRWWGSDERHQLTQKAVDAFEAKHENIKVKVQTFDWNSYYDQLTTTMAAGDAPDVFAVEIRRLGELGRAGQLADVGKLVDTSDLNAQLLRSGEVDGVLRAVPTGANTFSLMANTKVLDDVGVELPDDSTWSWDDYHALAAEVSGKTGRGVYGTQINFNDAFLQVFAAQHGQSLYEGGKLGVTADTVADWYGTHMDLLGKGAPPADLSSEIDATGVEQSLIATGKGAMGMWWSNQLGALTSGSGANVEMLRMPRSAGARTNGMFLQPTMHWAVAERSDAKEGRGEAGGLPRERSGGRRDPRQRPRAADEQQGTGRRPRRSARDRPEVPRLHRGELQGSHRPAGLSRRSRRDPRDAPALRRGGHLRPPDGAEGGRGLCEGGQRRPALTPPCYQAENPGQPPREDRT
ncbi:MULTISPECIES: extracellular solute-binding protein [unclassified Streptomyces]|uniref:ABC transporter substrate-binding protein n=1 Tax=unclassified Streptomyces TaxID=2593676 RepID=UPI001EFE42C6|nr:MULTISPECIES: extracellular solute-binding protein [unclassified Streptomyces]